MPKLTLAGEISADIKMEYVMACTTESTIVWRTKNKTVYDNWTMTGQGKDFSEKYTTMFHSCATVVQKTED